MQNQTEKLRNKLLKTPVLYFTILFIGLYFDHIVN